ncbi:MAG: carboxypeptidase regulatory-like domain-containing protein, partial [Myxococcales bacterium]|nr:carboxypeptidase regulatory-like domain-containing protein [Myxococcales bacterium]
MARALASACLLLVVCFGGSAWAARQKIAVLGLEAAPGPSGAVDPAMTQVARAITKELRQRAQSQTSPYELAPNSNKELTDEKLLMSCDNEAASCMAAIGAGLAADILLYGRVEKRGQLYRVSLKRLDVKAKSVAAGGEELPVGSAVVGLAKRLYIKLVGEISVDGALIVRATSANGAPITAGTVLIDETPRGTLAAGQATVSGLPEGRHVLAIEAGGYRRFEQTVTIRVGAPTTLDARLLGRDAPSEPASSGGNAGLWKISLGTSLLVGAAGGGLAVFSFYRMTRDEVTTTIDPDAGGLPALDVGSEDCGRTPAQIKATKHAIVTNPEVFSAACSWKTRIYYGFGVAGVGAVGAVVSLVMLARGSSPETSRTSARRTKPAFAVTPIVTPS